MSATKTGFVTTLKKRIKADTPPFFKKLRGAGLILAAIGGAIVAAPVALPAVVVTVGGYLVVAGSVATVVSQVAVEGEEYKKKKPSNKF